MAISDDLFLAILAMDSYNRGYNAGLTVAGTQIGNAVLGIGDNSTQAVAASFFAQAYTWNGEGNGRTVISYRDMHAVPMQAVACGGAAAYVIGSPT